VDGCRGGWNETGGCGETVTLGVQMDLAISCCLEAIGKCCNLLVTIVGIVAYSLFWSIYCYIGVLCARKPKRRPCPLS